jgi:hypothetical protein
MMYHQQVGQRLMLEERWDRFGDHQLAPSVEVTSDR